MQFAFDIIVAAISMVVVGQFAWALRYHFVNETVPFGFQLVTGISFLTSCLFLYLLFSKVQPLPALAIGLLIAMSASALFIAAIKASKDARLRYVFEGERSKSILRHGPYGYVRHPFYTSYLLLWAGWALATWTLWAFLPVLILGAFYASAARDEERSFVTSPLGDEYRDYRRQAGFFWPRLVW